MEDKNNIMVVTYNLHFGKNTKEIVTVFQQNKNLKRADVILFQEIEHHEKEVNSRAQTIAEALGYHFFYAPAREIKSIGTHGLATLSKFPIIENVSLSLPKYKDVFRKQERIALITTIEVYGEKIEFCNIHLDPRLNAKSRINQLDFALQELKLLHSPYTVIGGDFNTIPFYLAGKLIPIFYQNQLKKVHAHMLKNSFVNFCYPLSPTMQKSRLKMKLDHIYTNNLPIVSFGVENTITTSDHYPLWAIIET